jgi:hypothetical protein
MTDLPVKQNEFAVCRQYSTLPSLLDSAFEAGKPREIVGRGERQFGHAEGRRPYVELLLEAARMTQHRRNIIIRFADDALACAVKVHQGCVCASIIPGEAEQQFQLADNSLAIVAQSVAGENERSEAADEIRVNAMSMRTIVMGNMDTLTMGGREEERQRVLDYLDRYLRLFISERGRFVEAMADFVDEIDPRMQAIRAVATRAGDPA